MGIDLFNRKSLAQTRDFGVCNPALYRGVGCVQENITAWIQGSRHTGKSQGWKTNWGGRHIDSQSAVHLKIARVGISRAAPRRPNKDPLIDPRELKPFIQVRNDLGIDPHAKPYPEIQQVKQDFPQYGR